MAELWEGAQVEDLVNVTPLVVIGAGLSALAFVSRLPPELLPGVLVLDATGEWLGAWAARLRACGAEHVRVPCTSIPFPAALALREFAAAQRRGAELLPSSTRSVPLPSFPLFADFVAHQLPRSAAGRVPLRRARVTALEALEPQERARHGLRAGGIRVRLEGGGALLAAQVVLAATHYAPAPLPPPLAAAAAGGRVHVFARGAPLPARLPGAPGARVAVVGGGTSGATLALAALARGAAHVTLLTRSALRKREQEVECGWLGEARARPFRALAEPLERARELRAARRGGSVNARTWAALRCALHRGALRIEEGVEVAAAEEAAEAAAADAPWRLRLARAASSTARGPLPDVLADELWCACGAAPDAGSDPLLATLPPARLLGGLPLLEPGQRWPDAPLYLLGRYAALQLGPAAGLAAGQRAGAEAALAALRAQAAAAAAGDSPYDPPAGALPLDALYADEEALRGPWAELWEAATGAKPAGQGAEGRVDVSDLPPPGQGVWRQLGGYSWADGAEAAETAEEAMRIALRLPLPERCAGGGALRAAFAASSLELVAVGEASGTVYRLHLPLLWRRVQPRRCAARLSRDGMRVDVTLGKMSSEPWRFLVAA